MTATQTVADMIRPLDPCMQAVLWLEKYTAPEVAWQECHRGDWMLWLLGKFSGEPESDARRKLVHCAADCAAPALPHYEAKYPGDSRVRDCLAACRAYAAGDVSLTELRNAADAATAAAYAADAATAARNAALEKCANIVRKHYPHPPVIEALK